MENAKKGKKVEVEHRVQYSTVFSFSFYPIKKKIHVVRIPSSLSFSIQLIRRELYSFGHTFRSPSLLKPYLSLCYFNYFDKNYCIPK